VKPVEPETPTLGTPDVEFVELHADNNNSVWGGSTRAVRLVFSESFTAKAYDANDGGFDAPVIANVRAFVTINGQSLGNLTFLQIDNENSITFLYDESLLDVPAGQDYTTFTIEAGAPFGGHYLPAVTLYLVDGKWCENKPVEESITVTNIHNRYGSGQKILLFLSNSDYDTNNTDITAKIANTNVLDYVNVYTSETEYKTLREIYQNNAQAKIWGEANSIGFAVDSNYHGTAVYAIEIKAGAKFPAATNDYTTYVVSEDIAFYNADYNSADESLNSWAVVWSRMHVVTLEGELATGAESVKLYAVPGRAFAYPEAYSRAQAGDENTVYVYNWYLGGVLYNFSTPVTEDITLTADGTFTAYSSYVVTFDDGKTQSTVTVNDGALVAEPEAPTKEETTDYKYAFNGWYNGETRWDFDTPVTENITLTAKFDQLRKIVLSDLYSEGKSSTEIKSGEISIARSGDHYKGYVGNNLYFNLSLELSYTQEVELATFDVKITNDTYSEANTSPFYLSWHVYYQRPANTLYIEYHKYNAGTGARETLTAAVSTVGLSANTIYQANFAYRVIDEATGLVEMYSSIAGWENVITLELGAEYLATAADYEYIAFATEASAANADITLADPGLTGAPHYDVTLNSDSSVIMSGITNQIQLPSVDNEIIEDGISKVFVGWTTDLATLPDLYPAGYRLQLTGATELYAVWIGFDMVDGASVRLVTNSSGIRFTTEIDSAGYNMLGDYLLSVGTLVVPTEYLAYTEFVHSSFKDGYYIDKETEKWIENGGDKATWSYAAAFVNISVNQYARSFSARGYLKINFTCGEGYVYTPYDEELNARSIYSVATLAYNDTENDYKQNSMILEYVNSVADITLSNEMGLTKAVTAVGDYALESSLQGKTFTVSLSRDVSAVMINGTRVTNSAAKNVQIGQFMFSIKDVAINGSELTFTVDVASDIADKHGDGNVYFKSSDEDLDFFLNDYFTRHATGIHANGEDQTVNSVVAGKDSTEFFWWEWFSTAYYIMDTDAGFDRIEGLREKLSNVPVDDYGYVWQNTDAVRDANATLNSNEHRMGWPFPTAEQMVVTEAIRTSLWNSATTNYITKGYSTSWDFNGSDRTAWSSNVNAGLDGAGLFKGTASGASKVTFSSPTLPQTHTVKKYSGISSSNITVYDEPAIYTYYAPLLELDVRMSNADNVKDIVVYFKTNEGGSTEYSMSVNEYAFIKYDYSGTYEHMLFLPMYAHENWGDSETRYVTDIRIEIIPKDGLTLTGDFALSYVRPSLDTRHTNNNSIFISSLRQDYDYTGDLEFLEQNITRARKAMNFLMQFYDEERGLINSSYLVGHDSDKTGSDMAQRIAHSLGNGYWDISFMPEYDFHSNSYFYKAVADMAYLESVLAEKGSSYSSNKAGANVQTAGRQSNTTLGKGFAESDYSALDLNATAAKTLNALRATTSNTQGFWDATKGRFIAGYGDANADGVSEWVDYGYLVWNLEAIYYGIATEEQADLIMQWVTGERTVAGDTSTGEDIYFFELAPRATTYQGTSATDSSVYTGVWHGTNNGGEYGVSQVQHGGAIMYTSYYDLMNRINVNGTDDAYARLNAIKDWYMDVYAYYQTSGSTPDDFYWDYYENGQWDSDGDGNGEYWRIQNGIKGQAERDGFTGGIIGIDGEFAESFLPVSAIPYGFFGIESQGNGTLKIAPKLPGDLEYWTVENLTFNGCKYDVTIYDRAIQITSVDEGEATGLKLKVAFDAPATDYTVYVNGFATTEYEVVDGQIIVELAFGNAIVEIR
ncbi:MAG: InlB B-repeat-containing protein, partial [Clostridia bacterium]|nr:InlB B-repeat-containing protein [Clostridia bacterium]